MCGPKLAWDDELQTGTVKKKVKCNLYMKFDGHYTSECINEHGNRLNNKAKPHNFKYCPFCGKQINIPDIDRDGDYIL